MKNTLLILSILFAFIWKANAQKTNWIMPQKDNNGNVISRHVDFNSGAPVLRNAHENPYTLDAWDNSQPITSYNSMNAAYDENGKMLFYVVNTDKYTYIFDESNNNLYYSSGYDYESGPSDKITIIDLGCGKYHIISGAKIYKFDYYSNSKYITTLKTDLESYRITSGGTQAVEVYNHITRLVFDNNQKLLGYRVYTIGGNPIGYTRRVMTYYQYNVSDQTYESYDYTYDNDLLVKIQEDSNAYGWLYNFRGGIMHLTEMAFNYNGTQLAIAGLDSIFIFNIAADGKFAKTKAFNYLDTINYRRAVGLEFINDTLLAYSVSSYHEDNTYPYSPDYVAILNLNQMTSAQVASSANYARSHIETGTDSKIYVCASDGLYEFQWNHTPSPSFNKIVTYSPLMNQNQLVWQGSNAVSSLFTLPGQFLGQPNENYTEYHPANILTSLTLTASHNYDDATHGLTGKGNGPILITEKLLIKPGAGNSQTTINFTDMTFAFAENAVVEVYRGAQVNFTGTILKAGACGEKMWTGVRLMPDQGSTNPSHVAEANFKASQTKSAVVRDAFVGLKINGHETKAEIDGATFAANGKSIYLDGINALGLNIKRAWFDGTIPLLDKDAACNYFGAQYPQFKVNNDCGNVPDKTWVHIQANGCWNFYVGSNSAMNGSAYPIVLEGAEIGIYLRRGSMDIRNTEITKTKRFAVDAAAQDWGRVSNSDFRMNNCYIHNNLYGDLPDSRGVNIKDYYQTISIQNSQFKDLLYFGVNVQNNKGADILVRNNVFDNVNSVGLNLQENMSFQYLNTNLLDSTKIIVDSNTFKNRTYGIGVNVYEPSKPMRSSYSLFMIYKNTFTNIPRGVNIENVIGGNAPKPLATLFTNENTTVNGVTVFDFYNKNFIVSNNNLSIREDVINQSPSHYGIRSRNSSGLNYIYNKIMSHDGKVYSAMYGITMYNSPNSLVNKDTVAYMDIGMYQLNDMTHSNYTCNSFDHTKYGYFLREHKLRNAYPGSTLAYRIRRTHGIPNFVNSNSEGNRMDSYNSVNTQIHLHKSNVDNNYWSFNNIIFNNHNQIRIGYYQTTGGNTIIQEYSYDRCHVDDQIAIVLNDSTSEDYDSINYVNYTPLELWTFMDYINREYYAGRTSTFFNDYDINTVHLAERLISEEKYDSASVVLSGFTPVTSIAHDYKQIYSAWVNTRLNDVYEITDTAVYLTDRSRMDSSYITILTQIAQKNILTESPYATTARMMLWMEFGIELEEPEDQPVTLPAIAGVVADYCNLQANTWNLWLEKENIGPVGIQVQSDSSGNFWIGGYDVFTQLDTNVNVKYRLVATNTVDSLTQVFTDYMSLWELASTGLQLQPVCAGDSHPDLTGWVNTGCAEMNGAWNVQIENNQTGLTSIATYTDQAGNFYFNGDYIFAVLDSSNNYLYRIVATAPDLSTNLTSGYYTPGQLIVHTHILDCMQSVTGVGNIKSSASRPIMTSMSQGELHIVKGEYPCRLRITDLSGRVLVTEKLSLGSQHFILPLNMLSNGVYLLQIENLNTHEIYKQKLVKID